MSTAAGTLSRLRHFPPRRGGVDAPSEAKAQTGWSVRRHFAGLTTIEASPYRARASRPALQPAAVAPPLLCEGITKFSPVAGVSCASRLLAHTRGPVAGRRLRRHVVQ